MAVRYWTVEEAQAYLPRLRVLLEVIRRAAHLTVAARGNGHASMPGASSSSAESSSAPGGEARGRRPAEPGAEPVAAFDVAQALEELAENDITLRDPDLGIIDFRARHPNGRDVLLCWQLSEDDLGWWHLPEDGFAGRRPLPLPPEL